MKKISHFLSFLHNSFIDSIDELDESQIKNYTFYCCFGFLFYSVIRNGIGGLNIISVLRILGILACLSLLLKTKLTPRGFRYLWFSVLFLNQGALFLFLFLSNPNDPVSLFDLSQGCITVMLLCNARVFCLYFFACFISFPIIKNLFFSQAEVPRELIHILPDIAVMAGYCMLYKKGQTKMYKDQLSAAQLLSAMMAHELRTPLTAMLFRHNKLKIDFTSNFAEKKQCFEDIVEMGNLIKRQFMAIDMLLEKLKLSCDPIELQKCSIVSVVKSAIENNYFLEDESDKISYESLKDFYFLGDYKLGMHIFLNLIRNSLYQLYKQEDKKIIISSEEDEKYNKVIFYDNGPGIDKEFLHYLFKPFKTKTKTGSGLGLYFCRFVMENLFKGDIEVKSSTQTASSFTKFILYFPKIRYDNALQNQRHSISMP